MVAGPESQRLTSSLRKRGQSVGSASWRILRSLRPIEIFSLSVVGAILILTAIGRLIAPYNPEAPNAAERLLAPSATHWFGTDENGTDILSRILAAPRTDVLIAVVATSISVSLGVGVGVIAGYFEGGRRKLAALVGEGILRLLDVVQAFPVFVLAMVLVAIRGPGTTNIIAAIAFVNIPVFIRLVRSEMLSLRERPYTEAARVIGGSDLRIGFRHLLPNSLPPVVVQVSVTLGFAILLTAGLSFVGAGVEPPTPELGSMISTGAKYMVTGQWWPSLVPGIALGLTVFAFAGVGEAVGRMLEPGAVRSRAAAEGLAGPVVPETALALREVVQGSTLREIDDVENPPEAEGRDDGPAPDAARRLGVRSSDQAIVEVSGLRIEGDTDDRRITLLDDVFLHLSPGETLGIVGESGSGKSVLVRALLRLLPEGSHVVGGEIRFRGRDLLSLSTAELRRLRGTEIAPILPDAKAQLNPVLRIGTVMTAVIRAHEKLDRGDVRERAVNALRIVGIPDPEQRLNSYPHELSGGMAQRVCIALALLHNPRLIVADEPTFGLDVTVQRQVLDLMHALVEDRGAAQVIVTRDLGIAAHYCQRIAVMQAGKVVETATTPDLFGSPRAAYTRRLLDSASAGRIGKPVLTGTS